MTTQAPARPLAQDLLRDILALAKDTPESVAEDATLAITATAFQPRDDVETMIAGLAVAHVRLLHKSMNEVLRMLPGPDQFRGKSQIVALDRMLLGYLRELRTARKRPVENLAAPAPKPANPPDRDVKSRAPRPDAAPIPARSVPDPRAAAFGAVSTATGKDKLLSGISGVASGVLLRPPAAAQASHAT